MYGIFFVMCACSVSVIAFVYVHRSVSMRALLFYLLCFKQMLGWWIVTGFLFQNIYLSFLSQSDFLLTCASIPSTGGSFTWSSWGSSSVCMCVRLLISDLLSTYTLYLEHWWITFPIHNWRVRNHVSLAARIFIWLSVLLVVYLRISPALVDYLPDPEGSGILSDLTPFKIQMASMTSFTPAGGLFIVFTTVMSYKQVQKVS